MSLTFTDLFCGAGGSSLGLSAAGLHLRLAANHWSRAIETHAANFPQAEHLCADVNNYDMRRLPHTDVLWASPICTEISPAGGRRRHRGTRGQLALFDHGPVATGAFERTRATAFDVIRAVEVHRYTAVLIENVVEFATDWELFDWWLAGMVQLGYHHQVVCASSAHIGAAGNPHAPQWRDRLYIVFTRVGVPLPDVTPRPVAWCPACDATVNAVQSWKNPRKPRIGKYRQQYLYRCPNNRCHHTILEPYVAPAAQAIDWSDPGTRIGDRTRPLAEKTMARIRAGLATVAEPTLVPACGTACEAEGEAEGVPVASPFLSVLRSSHPYTIGTDSPLATLVASGSGHALIQPEPFVAMLRRHATATPTSQPLATLTASGNHHALVIPYRRGARATTTRQPLHTLHTHESAALLAPAVDVDDCHFRMLKPREHLRGQRFPDTYTVTGNQGEQTMQAGNAVSANVAQWLGHQVATALDTPT